MVKKQTSKSSRSKRSNRKPQKIQRKSLSKGKKEQRAPAPNKRFGNRQHRSRGKTLPREVKKDMNIQELHKIAKSLGIAYAGLNKVNLIKKINVYL